MKRNTEDLDKNAGENAYLNKRPRCNIVKNRLRPRQIIQDEQRILKMSGIPVFLPKSIELYPSQRLMISRIIQTLKEAENYDTHQSNMLVESPTGTGKTLALIVSTCSWLIEYKKRRTESILNCAKHSKNNIDEGSYDNSTLPELEESSFLGDITKEDDEIILLDDKDEENIPFNDESSKSCKNKSPISGKKEEIACTCLPVVRIYYGTRTHKQIAQVVKEYGQIPFGDNGRIKHTILASREQTCINESIKNEPSAHDIFGGVEGKSSSITSRCKELLATEHGCMYRMELKRFDFSSASRIRSTIERTYGEIWDLEDLVQALHDVRPMPLCPYFAATRCLTLDADIIFCPFNYLLDPIIRNSSDIHLRNSIVILDEAHNVEDNCRDSASFEFTEGEIQASLMSLTQKIEEVKQLRYEKNLIKTSTKKKSDSEINEPAESLSSEEKLSVVDEYIDALSYAWNFMKNVRNFFERMLDLTDERKSTNRFQTPTQQQSEFSVTFGSDVFLASLRGSSDEENLLMPRGSTLHEELKRTLYVLSGRQIGGSAVRSEQDGIAPAIKDQFVGHLRPLAFVFSCIEKFLCFSVYLNDGDNHRFYKCNLHCVRSSSGSSSQRFGHKIFQKTQTRIGTSSLSTGSEWLSSRNPLTTIKQEPSLRPGMEITLNFWCMFPSVAFIDAFKEVRSVILASGTLSPIETLKTELGLEFKGQIEGEQVIKSNKIFACVLSEGPNNKKMLATYNNIFGNENNEFIEELARIIVSICKIVPKGILCFVSSYNVLERLYDTLISFPFDEMLSSKRIFKEPRRTTDLQRTLDDYTNTIQNPSNWAQDVDGALMLAVFRGKVSEGIDFSDDMARCVICVGIPYPNAKDEIVNQKKLFNDDYRKTAKNILTGDDWYTTQAYRALNQALGRCLRHRNDWGALILVDERFLQRVNKPEGKKISRWIRRELGHYANASFSAFEQDLRKFIVQMTTIPQSEMP